MCIMLFSCIGVFMKAKYVIVLLCSQVKLFYTFHIVILSLLLINVLIIFSINCLVHESFQNTEKYCNIVTYCNIFVRSYL